MSTISGGTRGVGIGVADYVVFGVSLVIPVIISLYFCCIKKQTSNSDFLMGNRSINAIPMSFSLCASYMSAVIITGKYQKVQTIIARIIYNFNCMNISLIMIILYFCFSFQEYLVRQPITVGYFQSHGLYLFQSQLWWQETCSYLFSIK